MKILSMRATFGKLEHATLTLKPGLNIIEAPNEWGKSTWCAFLAAMLYGLDTRAKSTKTTLVDKERYAPWSGSPMEGRLDIQWRGKNITIERKTKGRIPLGEFRAYETESGLPVRELTAANCGQLLLGVERSVFLRAGFLRLGDLPVTNDEHLRRRLNDLVTTGDESGAGQRLAEGLRAQKNRIRYHKTGLLPQAEAERAALQEKINRREVLETESEKLRQQLKETEEQIARLENHKKALAYAAAQSDGRRVAEARQLRDAARNQLREAEASCRDLPRQEQVQWMLTKIKQLEQESAALEMEARMVTVPIPEVAKPAFAGNADPEALLRQVIADVEAYNRCRKQNWLLPVAGLLLGIGGGVLAFWQLWLGLIAAVAGAVLLLAGLIGNIRKKRRCKALAAKYGSADPSVWVAEVQTYAATQQTAEQAAAQQDAIRTDIQQRTQLLEEKILRITQGLGLNRCRKDWEAMQAAWDAFADARREYQRTENHLQTLSAMAKTAERPTMQDTLTHSPEETGKRLSEGYEEKDRLQSRLHQYAGRLETLGDQTELAHQMEALDARIKKLEKHYQALNLAQETLTQATEQLQRRFAPRIVAGARERMAQLTEDRYDRLQLGQDLSLLAGAEGEDTLREALWRSDGTVDQLYLALRLAVAEALSPAAPLVLDDALARFDDTRLKAAMALLQKESQHKQVILFTCHSREANIS